MPNATIKFDRSTGLGANLDNALVELNSAHRRLQLLLEIITQADGAGVPAGIEVGGVAGDLFGVGTGQGAQFVTDVTGLAGALTVANRASLARLIRR